MTELWVIYALAFGAAVLGVYVSYSVFVRERQNQKAIARRLRPSSQISTRSVALEKVRRERGLYDFDQLGLGGINDFLSQTGLRFDRRLFVGLAILLGTAFFIVLGVAVGFGILALTIAILADVATVLVFLALTRAKRIAKFSEQFPDAIDTIVRGLRVGHPLSAALDLVAREMSDPVGTEFGMTSDEIAFGLDIRTAIANLYRRVGQEDLLFFVIAVNIQTQTGGNLAEILSRLATLIRQRIKLRLKVKAITAEGRLSAVVLSLMPFVLIAGITALSPDYFSTLRAHPIFLPAVVVGLISLLIGNLIMYRMVNFKF